MKLKRLDIHGFKSFYHRTTLAFDDGITAVVGPNGCGKSNIVDSIKWVMGEQGARSLRGNAMEDVIFAGSERRGPMGLCEVRLTFHNDGSADVPVRWHDVGEIAVERTLERTRGSDYRINQQRCRLADVQELIAGTGVGSGPGGQRAYAIVEQGQIGGIVSAKADERRMLIEEAAGITRYRTRRRQAEKKMEETRANLERLLDVIGEVEGQLKGLRRAARKAERYREYEVELREIALRRGVFEYRAEAAGYWASQQDVVQHEARLEDAERGLVVATAGQAAADAEEKLADEHLREVTEALREAEHAVRGLEDRLSLMGQQADELRRQLAEAEAEEKRLAHRAAELADEAEAAAARWAATQAEEQAGIPLIELENRRRDADRALLDARAALEGLRRADAEEARALVRAQAEAEAGRRQVKDLRARSEVAAAEARALAAEGAALGENRGGIEAAEKAAEAAMAAADAARQAADQAREVAQGVVRDAARAERAAGESLTHARAREKVLKDLEARREGLGQGSKLLLEAGLPGIEGPVTARLDVPAEYEAAVAAALGARLKGLVVADGAVARAALAHLGSKGKGQAVLIRADVRPGGSGPVPDLPGVVGPLAALISVSDPVVAALLAPTLLVEDLEAALRVAPAWPGLVVTRQGERVSGTLEVRGGAEGADTAPLSRRRELNALVRTIQAAEAERGAAVERLRTAEAEVRARQQAAEEAGRSRHKAELARAEARKDRGRLEAESARLTERVKALEGQAARLLHDASEAEVRTRKAEEAVAAAEVGHVDRHGILEETARRVHDAEGARDVAVANLHTAKAEQAARQARRDAAEAAAARIARQQRELGETGERLARGRSQAEGRRTALSEARLEAEQALASARLTAAEQASMTAEARAAHQEAGIRRQAAHAGVEGARKRRDAERDAHTEARLAVQARRMRMEHLAERLEARFKVDLEQALETYADSPPPSAEETERQAQLETLIERLGPVNLSAIEECAEVEERFTFLGAQRADLDAALNDLTAAIERIDRTSRRLFKETFEAVNEKFQALFPRLFRGGEARLELTDPDDLLGTGIEMLVCPPGKKVQSVTLLSGGEKAMCAIALVFAVFQVKPSPFCLLDEVDAPLDDANIGRFNEVVREMSRQSQIVLITHNKRTMEIADVLYGITMEEAGISKLVSVRMQ